MLSFKSGLHWEKGKCLICLLALRCFKCLQRARGAVGVIRWGTNVCTKCEGASSDKEEMRGFRRLPAITVGWAILEAQGLGRWRFARVLAERCWPEEEKEEQVREWRWGEGKRRTRLFFSWTRTNRMLQDFQWSAKTQSPAHIFHK